MKEPLVSELKIPYAFSLYPTGNNIFMKDITPPPKKVIPLTDFFEEQSYLCLIPSMFFFTLTDNFSKFHVNQSTNEGVIQVIAY
jgi:hypothetical protein